MLEECLARVIWVFVFDIIYYVVVTILTNVNIAINFMGFLTSHVKRFLMKKIHIYRKNNKRALFIILIFIFVGFRMSSILENESSRKHSICFVSAYFPLRKTPYFTEHHPEEWTPESLIDIVSLGVPFCLYIGKECVYETMFREWEENYPNFRVMSYRTDYHDTLIHKTCIDLLEMGIPVSLPEKRNPEKDTYEYLVYMNSRVELMEDAISENIWNTTHYAWVDYHSSTLFKQKEDTLEYLKQLSLKPLTTETKTIVVPGCWAKPDNMKTIATAIYWRFCGSFFLGDAESIHEFADLYRRHFAGFLEKYRCLPWEVNFWAYLEHEHEWRPLWYKGDHNDSLVHVSADIYTRGLSDRIVSKSAYSYPEFAGFYPGSASHLFHNGKHLLNTRYVSYWVYPNGYYRFHNNDTLIENRNIVSELDAETMRPLYYRKMNKLYDIGGEEIMTTNTARKIVSEGLEDIRLYPLGDTVRFIATTYGYSKNERSRMMIGDYKMDELEYRNCRLIQPPTDSMCEKNWVPLPKYNTETREWEEWFVYKWCPFELGRIDSSDTLRIEHRFDTKKSVFGKIRGSTTFMDYGDGKHLVGLVHFSEDHTPRHYYHMLVLLDQETFEPRRYSETFFFEKLAIEFCIGMYCNTTEQTYTFWISRFDRDPLALTVRMEDIPFI